ncbi:MAG: hypothetical protein ACPG6V_09540 [Flavobacteriales bacterium]
MKEKIMFIIIFIFSLIGLKMAGVMNWLILSLIVQILWLTRVSNKILNQTKSKNKTDRLHRKFNRYLITMLIVDLVVIFLSLSFAFRLLFAWLYQPLFILSIIGMLISLITNYFVLVNHIKQSNPSLFKKIFLVLTSLFYPLGTIFIKVENEMIQE